MLILAAFVAPIYPKYVTQRKESVLQNNLLTLRQVIGEYAFDQKAPPTSLEELVTRGYLRAIPIDPFTGNNQWRTAIEDESPPGALDGSPQSTLTVHSTSQKRSLKGDPYSRW